MIPTVPRTRPSRVHVLSAALGGLMAVGAASGWYALAPRAEAHVATDASTSTTAAAPGAASYADLVQKVMPAVVTVRSERMVQQTSAPMDDDMFRRFFGDQMPEMPRQSPRRAGGLGSGVVVNADGYILTNNHVVEGAQKLRVEFSDGRTADAKLVGTDKPSDLAVLKVQLSDLPVVPIGNSDGARVGDVVFAVGNPLGIGQTVTMGIVSAKGRVTGSGDGSFEDFIQTDAPINQGNSGGALINTNGELIGINAQILSPVGYNIGIGFSIPSNMARRVMDQLIENGHVRRGMLGVTVQGIDADMAKSLGLERTGGAIVSEVQPGSPAEKAGVRTGDVVLALNGAAIDSSNALRNQVAPLGPGASVKLSISRDGEKKDVDVTLAELPSDQAASSTPDAPKGSTYGMSVQPLTPELARELGKDAKGVVVADVNPDSPAADAGLQKGDVIRRVNGGEVESAESLKAALDQSGDRPSLLLVSRDGRNVFVTLTRTTEK
jgi:serine protease Do